MTQRIVILFHERDRVRDLSGYAISYLAEYWRADGLEIVFSFGLKRFDPADLAILHVDLSVVPAGYLELAQRYPLVLNGRVGDIRKSSFSRNLLRRGEPYDGPVIVKSDLNYGGIPERALGPFWIPGAVAPFVRKVIAAGRRRNLFAAPRFESSQDYPIYPRLADVPAGGLRSRKLVVEKFLPEREGELYCVRNYEFLGDRATCTRVFSRHPIVNDRTLVAVEEVDVHPAILALRPVLGFDYGKFDYVMHEGEAVLLDINKTVGASAIATPELKAKRRHRASGIHSYLVAGQA